MLMQATADTNIPNSRLQTPLHVACKEGAVGVVSCLIHGRAEMDAKDDQVSKTNDGKAHQHNSVHQGSTALHVAASCGQPAVALILLKAAVDSGSPRAIGNNTGKTENAMLRKLLD